LKNTEKLDGFLDGALWFFGSGVIWSALYFGTTVAGNTYMFVFPVLIVTVALAFSLFVTAFVLMRGFPLGDVSAGDRESPKWSDEKRAAFENGFEKRKKRCARLALASFGMLIPVAADLFILFAL